MELTMEQMASGFETTAKWVFPEYDRFDEARKWSCRNIVRQMLWPVLMQLPDIFDLEDSEWDEIFYDSAKQLGTDKYRYLATADMKDYTDDDIFNEIITLEEIEHSAHMLRELTKMFLNFLDGHIDGEEPNFINETLENFNNYDLDAELEELAREAF